MLMASAGGSARNATQCPIQGTDCKMGRVLPPGSGAKAKQIPGPKGVDDAT